MKKQLLFSASIFVSGLLCAQVSSKVSKVPSHLTNLSLQKSAVVQDQMYTGAPFQAIAKPIVNNTTKRVSATTEFTVGFTNYDLQSNGSVGDRIVVNADGSVATCWTYSQGDGGTYADRGTGYNYSSNNGATWGPIPTTRVENLRVGWGNIVNTRSGKEVILSHGANNATTNLATRATKGTGAWSNSPATPLNVSGGNWWPRMVSSSPRGGDTIYALTITYPVANGGAVYNGLNGAVLFSRSLDAGATWDIVNQIPTGLTSAEYTGFSGDGYAIAANGSTVAIVAGDSGTDLTLAKSTDGGITWTSTIVMQFPFPKWDPTQTSSDIHGDGIADRLETNDGNLAIAIDNYGKAFVAYGRMVIFDDLSGPSYSYYPYTDGLYIWNESMPTHVVDTIVGNNIAAVIEDLGQQGINYFPAVAQGSYPFGMTRGSSLTSFPSLAFDASNTLYMGYSSIRDSLISVDNEKVMRHEYIIRSCDEGMNWSAPFDVVPLSPGAEAEGIYGSIAKNVDGSVHMVYQRDYSAGNGIPAAAGSPANPDGVQIDAGNDMIYVKVPTADLPPCPTIITGIKNTAATTNLTLYPNPTSGILNINTLEVKSSVEIFNVIGEKVYSNSIVKGNNVIDLSSLSNGAYFVKINSNNQITTKKVILSK